MLLLLLLLPDMLAQGVVISLCIETDCPNDKAKCQLLSYRRLPIHTGVDEVCSERIDLLISDLGRLYC